MKIETIENIFNFLKEKEGKELPNKWVKFLSKLEVIKELENHPEGIQFRHNSFLDLFTLSSSSMSLIFFFK